MILAIGTVVAASDDYNDEAINLLDYESGSSTSSSSGDIGISCASHSIVYGKVYCEETGKRIKNASVEVKCIHNSNENIKYDNTNRHGIYFVSYNLNKCSNGDTVVVTAEKDGLTGTSTGQIRRKRAHVNVAIQCEQEIPEFSATSAIAALAFSAAGFLFLRRKKVNS